MKQKTIKFKKITEQPMMIKARRLGKLLYNGYKTEEKRGYGCGNLLLNWIKECYWGHRIEEYLPVFDKIWQMLHKRGYTNKNKFVYGDDDVAVWVEYSKDGHRKVIVSESYCSCADDNTHIFIRDKYEGTTLSQFRAVTVWHREKHYPKNYNFNFGDDRDIKIPSLNTYRKRDFDYGYFDCRDEGHCFTYNDYSKRAEDAYSSENKIEHALWTLMMHLQNLKESRVEGKHKRN